MPFRTIKCLDSMGGGIAVKTALHKLGNSVTGVVVLDVVEGSAIEALASMRGILQNRPKSFSSLMKAVMWR